MLELKRIIHKISRKGTTILWQTTLGIELSEFSPRNMKKEVLGWKNSTKFYGRKKFFLAYRPTWEPAKRINAQVPLVVEAYEKEKQKAASNGEPTGTSAESLEATAKCNAESPKRTRHSVTLPARKIKVVGVVRDNGRNVENSTLLVENESSGEQWCMQYEDIKREYSIELIEFFEGCISGFTNEVTFTNLTEAACICMESSGNAHMIKAYEARLDSDYGVF
ncbi:N-succinylarginine dihydrolase [Dirofilaria immitis]